MQQKTIISYVVIAILVLLAIGTGNCACTTIEPGHVGVAVYFGEVKSETYEAGTHFTNPLYDWTIYDCRQKTLAEENVPVPTADQMSANIDVSVQYQAESSMAHTMLSGTGTLDQVVKIHMEPKVRSLLREQGKGLKGCEDFFHEEVQQRMQTSLATELGEFMRPKGVTVSAVLIRNVQLPQVIIEAVQSRKTREQEAERQKVELGRFITEQQQHVEEAKASREAAIAQAEQIKALADARAYEIATQGKVLRENADVLKWEAIKKWNGTLPTVMSGDASMLLNINP